jgi:hypothetical protein
LEPEIKPSLFSRISSWPVGLRQKLLSFWGSLFSKPSPPSPSLLKGKSKLPRRIRDRERQLRMQVKEPKRARSNKILWEVLGGFATLLTIVAFYLSYIVPKLSVDTSGSLQAANPLATVFYLSNDGTLPVHNILAACGEVQFKAGNYQVISEPDARFIFPESKAEILSPGHKMSLPCSHLFGVAEPATITRAEITIIVDYRPDWVPWRKTARFPWKAEKTETGWIWKSLPR